MSDRDHYKAWLLERVLIQCWTLKKCAKWINRNYELVERDFDEFIKEGSNAK